MVTPGLAPVVRGGARVRVLHECAEVLGMRTEDPLRVGRFVEHLERVLPDRVEHPEPAALPASNEALEDERLDEVDVAAADGLRRVEREAAAEDREPPEELLLPGRKQLVAPFDRGAQSPLAFRRPVRPRREERQALLEPVE